MQVNEPNDAMENEQPRPSSKDKLREIKKLLLGDTVIRNDGTMTAGGGLFSMTPGLREGSMSVLFFGVRHRSYQFETSFRNNTQAVYQTAKAMQEIGRLVDMETAPKAAVCYVTSYVFRPVVLMFEEAGDEKKLMLRTFCGRSPFAFVAARRAVSRLEKVLPKQVKRKKLLSE